MLVLLGVDYWWRIPESKDPQSDSPESKRSEGKRKTETILATTAVLAIGFTPRWTVFVRELHSHLAWPHSVRFLFLNAVYNLYIFFVSQSVASWFLRFFLPAALCLVGSLFVFVAWFV